MTKILPNVRVNTLVLLDNDQKTLELFRKFFGAVRANFWLCGSFLAPEFKPLISLMS